MDSPKTCVMFILAPPGEKIAINKVQQETKE